MERKKPNVKYFHIVGSKCHILNDKEYHQKWDSKLDEGIFLGYNIKSRAYRVYNKCTRTVVEYINVMVNDTDDLTKEKDNYIEIFKIFDVPNNTGSQHNDTSDSSDVSITDCQTPIKEAESTKTNSLRLQSHPSDMFSRIILPAASLVI